MSAEGGLGFRSSRIHALPARLMQTVRLSFLPAGNSLPSSLRLLPGASPFQNSVEAHQKCLPMCWANPRAKRTDLWIKTQEPQRSQRSSVVPRRACNLVCAPDPSENLIRRRDPPLWPSIAKALGLASNRNSV